MNQLKTARPLIIMLLLSVFTIPISLFLNWQTEGKEHKYFIQLFAATFSFVFRKLQIPSVGKARPSFSRIQFIWLYVSLLYDWLP